MDYEKAYKESFEAAKGLHDAGNALTKKQMEIVFPQLAESEDESKDERIRKALVKLFQECDTDIEFCNTGFTYQEILVWLEKQKEQKSVQSEVEREYVRTLKSLISDFIRGKEEVDRKYYQQIYDWLDGRHIEQKPAEWSEEDSEMMMRIINQVGGYTYFAGMDSERVVNWLKSIRPVSKESLQSWKPSEEQMKALSYAIQVLAPRAAKASEELESLREQLKKL